MRDCIAHARHVGTKYRESLAAQGRDPGVSFTLPLAHDFVSTNRLSMSKPPTT